MRSPKSLASLQKGNSAPQINMNSELELTSSELELDAETDMLIHSPKKDEDHSASKIPSLPVNLNGILSCVMYSVCSVAMVLTNKAISSVVDPEFKAQLPQVSIIVFQCGLATLFVEISRYLGYVDYPPFEFRVALSWLPLNLLFIGMLVSGFLSLVFVSVPMVTIFKNLTNLVTVFGDWYFFNEEISTLTVIAIILMSVGAVLAGANDLQFSTVGYCWMVVNCICTSSYTLYMRYASVHIKLPRFGMVFYNNLLSFVLLLPLVVIRNEMHSWTNGNLMTPKFVLMNCLAGLFGFYLNFSSLWCVAATSATTYAIVGSVNKVPITVLGFTLFGARITDEGLIFIIMATVGGMLYAYAKLKL